MNFIFISPQFPSNYWHFCQELKNNGVTVLGIGNASYDSLSYSLKMALDEYYRVDDMENYDQMMRAVAYFTFKYGKIDWLESNNEYWLRQDARLRTDFNITTGYGLETMTSLQSKSAMKAYYQQAEIPCAPCRLATDRESVLSFAAEYGYPLIIKPDIGVGANDTHRICNAGGIEDFFASKADVPYIVEPFIDGTICSYDAIVDSKGNPLFESGNVTPIDIMDCVANQKSVYFYIEKDLPEDMKNAGRRCVKAFGVKSRFVHFEFFRLNSDISWLGKQGTIVGLEANLRPSGGFTPDMLNFANSTDVYRIWADMVSDDRRCLSPRDDHYYSIYAGRRDSISYVHSHEEVLSKFRSSITMSDRMPQVLATGMGDQMYIAKFSRKEDMDAFIAFVLEV